MIKYKTTLAHRLSQKKYRLAHLEEQRLLTTNWKSKHPERIKKLNKKWNEVWHPINNPKRIKFKGKHIQLEENPRMGVCSKCKKSVQKGEIKQTHMHHLQYDESKPLAHTIELCASCHRKYHVERI